MTTFHSFADLADYAGLTVKVKGKKLKKSVPENSFLHVKELAGKPAAVIFIAINDQECSKKSGPDGYPMMTVAQIVEDTGFDEGDVVTGIIRLAKVGLISKITPDGKIAA